MSVPWVSVRKAPGDFISAKYLPTGMKMDDPSKIRLAEADRLLAFWRQRQKDKIRPTFEFKAWEGDDKTMREPVDTTSSEDSDTGPRVPVKKSTGKLRRRVEQDTSDEDQEDKEDKDDKDDKEGDKDDKEDKDDKTRKETRTTRKTRKETRMTRKTRKEMRKTLSNRLLQSPNQPKSRAGPVWFNLSRILDHRSRIPCRSHRHLQSPNQPRSGVGLVRFNLIQRKILNHRSRNPSSLVGAMEGQKTTPVPVLLNQPEIILVILCLRTICLKVVHMVLHQVSRPRRKTRGHRCPN